MGVATLLMVLLLSGCDNHTRPIYENPKTWLRLEIDWEPAQINPYGMTICVYDLDNKYTPRIFNTHSAKDSVKLEQGRYGIIVFNETTETHEGMTFSGMDRYETAVAMINQVTTHGEDEEPITAEIDVLAVASDDDVEITADMIKLEQTQTLRLVPKRLTTPLNLTVHIKGLLYVSRTIRTSKATLSGMASGVYLHNGETVKTPVTNEFTFSERIYDEGSTVDGVLVASTASFGLARGTETPDGLTGENILNVDIRLRNETWYPTFTRDVTQAFKFVEHTLDSEDRIMNSATAMTTFDSEEENRAARLASQIEMQLELEIGLDTENDPLIVIPYVPNSESGGAGMDADVSDWGDPIYIPVN